MGRGAGNNPDGIQVEKDMNAPEVNCYRALDETLVDGDSYDPSWFATD